MKKLFLASVATSTLMMGSANAADMPRPAMKAVAAPVPVYSWSGCAVGAQVGWGYARNKIGQTQFNTFAGVTLSSSSRGNVDASGAMFGGQVGCDYQFAGTGWVIGVQGMFAGTDFSRTEQDPHNGAVQVSTNPGLNPGITFGGGSVEVRTKWLASATARLGYAWSPETLAYVKGGGAWTENQIDLRGGTIGQFNLVNQVALFNATHTGWTVGGGLEWRILGNWTAFAEYNYYNFQDKGIFAQVNGPPNVNGQTLRNELEMHTATVGVNYRFNWGGGGVVARY